MNDAEVYNIKTYLLIQALFLKLILTIIFSWEDVTESTPMTVHIDEDEGVVVKADITNNHNNGTQPQHQQQQQQPVGNGISKNVALEDLDGAIQFTSIVSASFLLVHCPNWMSCDLISLVDQLHKVSFKLILSSC